MDQPGVVVSHADTRNQMVEGNEARGQTADFESRERVICRAEYFSFVHSSVSQQLAGSF